MSWPTPEPGLVVRYAYLWRREQEAGREEGTKDRPCAVVLALAGEEGERPRVVVLPITHSPPQPPTEGIKLPLATKRRLGLDDEQSWVVVSEANRFLWPGPDLRFLLGRGPESAAYGVLPPDIFRVVRDRFLAELRTRRAAVIPRTE
ncbi:MAG: hypothetical protein EON57_17855 [Alphaproteobacteria bacterium]|nr:MAG: hypothetical protein EON57_17855 [Alphaproteobacteria bacterium]